MSSFLFVLPMVCIRSRRSLFLPCLFLVSILTRPAQAQYNFGSVKIGQSKTLMVSCLFFTSPSGGTVTVTSDGITGSNASFFTKSDDTILGTHSDGSIGTVDITFTPTQKGVETGSFVGNAYETIGVWNLPYFCPSASFKGTGIVSAVPECGTALTLCVLAGVGVGCWVLGIGKNRDW